jgi:hypothetical protein
MSNKFAEARANLTVANSAFRHMCTCSNSDNGFPYLAYLGQRITNRAVPSGIGPHKVAKASLVSVSVTGNWQTFSGKKSAM